MTREYEDVSHTHIYNVMSKDDDMKAGFHGADAIPVFELTMGGEFSGHVRELSTDKIDRAIASLRKATNGLELWNEDRKAEEAAHDDRRDKEAAFDERVNEKDNQ